MEENGVPMNVVEVQNEPNGEAALHYESPMHLREAALALIDQLDAYGLEHVMLHGPNTSHAAEAVEWAETWLEEPTLRERTAAISYHTWMSTEFEDYDAIRQLAEQHGKQVWATEVGYIDWSIPGQTVEEGLAPETWTYAFDAALSAYRAIAWSHAGRVYHWTAVGYDGFVSPTGERTPTFYAVKHFANYALPGATLLNSASGDDEVLALIFAMPDGFSTTAVLLNTSEEVRTMELSSTLGTPWSVLEGQTSTEEAYDMPVTLLDAATVELPPGSITSLWLQP